MSGNYVVGQIVFSKCGRDKDKAFIVISVEEEYVYLADGKLRKVESPKLKKKKHIQCTLHIVKWIEQKIMEDNKLTNSDVRKALDEYLEQSSVK